MNLQSLPSKPWFWPAAASLALWVLILYLSPEFRFGMVTANLATASFLALVGFGQMFPIASGEGGIDLSIPFVMNFCAFVTVKLIDANLLSVPLVLFLALSFGMLIGYINGVVVVNLRVPPIIGTLAMGFIVLTLVQIVASGGSTTIANRGVTEFVRGSFLGMPTPFFVVAIVGLGIHTVVERTVFGRSLMALGQSRRAAELAGVKVRSTILFAYLISGALAGLAGVLLAASVGSADLELGNPFLLTSVGAVVLGGNKIAGGMASVPGTMFGALLLTLLTLAVTVGGLPLEAKNIASGLAITIVLVAANAPVSKGPRGLRGLTRKKGTE